MNQLEALAYYQRQIIWDNLVNSNTIFLGDLYISFDEDGIIELYNLASPYIFDIVISKPYANFIDQSYMLSYVHDNFFIKNSVTLIGCHDICLLDDFRDQQDVMFYNSIQEMFLFMQSEYSEFMEYITTHFDEIIMNGGMI